MVRVFNHWFSPRKAVYFLAEETVLVLALLAGASLGPVAAHATGVAAPVSAMVLRAGLASLFFAGALYLVISTTCTRRCAIGPTAGGSCGPSASPPSRSPSPTCCSTWCCRAGC